MNSIMLVIVYLSMLAFDAFILAGTVYLIGWHGWSAWWVLLAVLIVSGSDPENLILSSSGQHSEQHRGSNE